MVDLIVHLIILIQVEVLVEALVTMEDLGHLVFVLECGLAAVVLLDW